MKQARNEQIGRGKKALLGNNVLKGKQNSIDG